MIAVRLSSQKERARRSKWSVFASEHSNAIAHAHPTGAWGHSAEVVEPIVPANAIPVACLYERVIETLCDAPPLV
jgi:hypothetical protein